MSDSFTFVAVLVGEDEAGAVVGQGPVHHHVALVVAVPLEVDGAVHLVELLRGVVDVLHLAVRLPHQHCQEVVGASNNLPSVKIDIDMLSRGCQSY